MQTECVFLYWLLKIPLKLKYVETDLNNTNAKPYTRNEKGVQSVCETFITINSNKQNLFEVVIKFPKRAIMQAAKWFGAA